VRRPGANLGQPNHAATLMLMGVASLALLLEVGKIRRGLAGMFFSLLIVGLAMTESRTGLLSAAILSLWWACRRDLFLKIRKLAPVVGAWTGLLLVVWGWPIFISHWYAGEGVGRISAGAGERHTVWLQLVEAVMERPWTGWGLRDVSEALSAVLPRHDASAPFSYAHNAILDLAIGVGLPLTFVFVAIAVYWGWRQLKGATTLQAWFGIAVAIPLVVHSMLEFPYAYAYFLIPVFVALGAMGTGPPTSVAIQVRLTHATAASLVLLGILAWSALEYLAIEEDFAVARFEALRIGQTPSDYQPPKIMLLTQLDAVLKATRSRPAPGMSEAAIEALRHAAMRFPWTAIQNRYALSLALNGNTKEALRQVQVMRAMHGERQYAGIKAHWKQLGEEQFSELKNLKLP